MASLLRKPAAETEPEGNAPVEVSKGNEPSAPRALSSNLRISLVIADVVLLALAARMVMKNPGRLGIVEVALCVLAIGLGAWLTCMALWRD